MPLILPGTRPGEGVQRITKGAAESVTSSAVLQNDNHLALPLAAGEEWVGQLVLFFTAPTAADIKIACTIPAGAEMFWSAIGYENTATGIAGSDRRAVGTSVSGSEQQFGGIGSYTNLPIYFWVLCGATPGDFQLQWAQGTSNATPTTVAKGSYLAGQRVPY